MHELSVALNIVGQASDIACSNGGSRVVEIKLLVGELCGVEQDALEFCFPLAAEGTPAQGAKLIIERQPALGRCLECGAEQEIGVPVFLCSSCSDGQLEIVSGRDFLLQSIGIE